MKQSKILLDPDTHKLVTDAQEQTGIARLDHALGALLLQLIRGEQTWIVTDAMLAGLPEYMKALHPPPKPKRQRKKSRGKGTA